MVELAELSDKAGRAGRAGKAGPTRLTPWHPVRVDTRAEEGEGEAGNGERRLWEWQFPAQIGDVRIFDTPAVYDFVLAQGHVVSGGRASPSATELPAQSWRTTISVQTASWTTWRGWPGGTVGLSS